MLGTKDQLPMNRVISVRYRKKVPNLCKVWVGFQKAHDCVLHFWITKCLKLYDVTAHVEEIVIEIKRKLNPKRQLKHYK